MIYFNDKAVQLDNIEYLKVFCRKICLKMDLLPTITPKHFGPKTCFSPWPSGLRRQTILDRLGKNYSGVRGSKIFFLFFYIFAWRTLSILLYIILYSNMMANGLQIEPEITKMWFICFSANWEIGWELHITWFYNT